VQTLYLFGAGHVSVNVYCGARMAGFEVVVVDDRESYANRERFPEAKDVYADDFEHVLSQLVPNHSSYLVIVTRGHRDDMRVLRWAVETPAKYIGMIGSQRKVIAIYKQLEKEGISLEKLARVYAPVGIDIGAITPEEIAIAIVAEMIAIRRGAATVGHKRSVKALELLETSKGQVTGDRE
jgi:xanthine dehydrogenase accessory factor